MATYLATLVICGKYSWLFSANSLTKMHSLSIKPVSRLRAPYVETTGDSMRKLFLFRLCALLLLPLAMAGCATNPGIVKTGSDTYTLYKVDHGGIFGNAELLRNDVIAEANAFAESQGKIALPVAAKSHHMSGLPADFASFEYQFRLIDKNDHTTIRTHLIPGSDVVVDDAGKVVGGTHTKSQSEKPMDRYDELNKLDDLRKRGVISEVEFEAQKKKILHEN